MNANDHDAARQTRGSHAPFRRPPILRQTPVIPVYLADVIVRIAEERGIPANACLAGTGLAPSHLGTNDRLLSLDQAQRIFENVWYAADDPTLGLTYGERLRPVHLGVMGMALLAAPTLRAALDCLVRYHRLLGPAWSISWTQQGAEAVVVMRRVVPLGDTGRLHTDAWMIAFARLLASLREKPISSGRIELDSGALPVADYAWRFAGLSGFEVCFDRPAQQLCFPADILDEPLSGNSPAAFRESVARCEEFLTKRDIGEDLLSMVMRHLRASVRAPTLEQLSAACGMSTRTLERRLSEFGLTYRDALDHARRDRALALVGETTLAFVDIAEMLGYSDVSSFSKSFKRWTGYTPSVHRGGATS
ncbi:AraC family transcriptional regulator [Oleomonas cavernae]|uniref:AraC family transcriptional regulator n=1 Tax=Oleomonas cavernae TaxID=2320859 RepID=A0A418WH17_9PROT|nr:AraC family transcriptional regulator [Oleomonas cavernae]RJF89280.1 AraC family transcriptional regulator [Oleomonas cavernae]